MLLPDIDEKETRDNVNQMLSNYHRLKRLAGKAVQQNLTTTYTFEPKSFDGMNSSPIETGVQKKIDADKVVEEIHRAINTLSSRSRKRIYFKYISPERLYDYEIYMRENIGHNKYYNDLAIAEIEFAESYCNGKLIEWKKRRDRGETEDNKRR